jgi:hypothetical protein
MSFSPGLLEASLVLIVNQDVQEGTPSYDFWFFLYPFEYPLWAAFVLALLIHGVAQMILDWLEPRKAKDRPVEYNAELHIWESVKSFNKDAYDPLKRSSRFLYLVFLFFLFVMMNAYSANLTSALILQNVNNLRITNINDANNQRAKVCFRKGAAAINLVC